MADIEYAPLLPGAIYKRVVDGKDTGERAVMVAATVSGRTKGHILSQEVGWHAVIADDSSMGPWHLVADPAGLAEEVKSLREELEYIKSSLGLEDPDDDSEDED